MDKIRKFNLNESYKEVKNYKKNQFGFDVPEYTYVDNVFDHLVQIICDVNHISEKDFTNWDNTRNYVEMYFDNNQDVLLDIDQYQQIKGRYQLCAEHLFNKHFQNDNIIETINNSDFELLLEKKQSKYKSVKLSLERSKKIPKNMKEKTEKFLNSGSKYNNGIITGLKKQKVKGKSFNGVSLGADKDGFFVYTHRARCKSYNEIEDITQKDLNFIKSTG